VINQDI